jgi:hypothetical protein
VAAQVNTSSPYSRFGLGEIQQPGFAQNLALGGTGIGLRSNYQINYLNPASYSAMDTMSFLFDFGIQGSQTTYTQNSSISGAAPMESKLNNYNIHHFAIGFGMTKNWKASIGIVPYSSVGYSILETKLLTGAGLVDYSYSGSGGLNRLFIGNSFRFFNHISVGVNLNYLFGYLNYENAVDFLTDTYAATSVIENRLTIGDFTYNLGLQYHETIGEKFFFTVGAVFDNDTKLKTSQSLFQTTFYPGSIASTEDSIIINPKYLVNSVTNDVQTLLPRNIGAGFSFGITNKLILAGDYTTQEWSKSFIPGKTDSLVNSQSLNIGIEYTPDQQALRGYFNRVHYRLGGYYSNSYLRIRGEQMQDYGMSFGVGLPIKGDKSSFNFGFIVGQRGTLNNYLIKENYGIVNFGLTLHDFWFFKIKFD